MNSVVTTNRPGRNLANLDLTPASALDIKKFETTLLTTFKTAERTVADPDAFVSAIGYIVREKGYSEAVLNLAWRRLLEECMWLPCAAEVVSKCEAILEEVRKAVQERDRAAYRIRAQQEREAAERERERRDGEMVDALVEEEFSQQDAETFVNAMAVCHDAFDTFYRLVVEGRCENPSVRGAVNDIIATYRDNTVVIGNREWGAWPCRWYGLDYPTQVIRKAKLDDERERSSYEPAETDPR